MRQSDQRHYELGWDYAMYRWKIPNDASNMFIDGYRAFEHGNRHKKRVANRFERKWLQIRKGALRRDKEFDPQITPDFIQSLLPLDYCCPVTREPLTFGEKKETDWSVERADNSRGYVPGNIIIISIKANKAKADYSLSQIGEIINGRRPIGTLSIDEWRRLADLIEPMMDFGEGCTRGVELCTGQRIAPGTPVSQVARFQQFIASCAIGLISAQSHSLCNTLLNIGEHLLCDTKLRRRRYRALTLSAAKRARSTRNPDEIWATQRVHRCLTALLNCWPREQAEERMKYVLDWIDETFLPESMDLNLKDDSGLVVHSILGGPRPQRSIGTPVRRT